MTPLLAFLEATFLVLAVLAGFVFTCDVRAGLSPGEIVLETILFVGLLSSWAIVRDNNLWRGVNRCPRCSAGREQAIPVRAWLESRRSLGSSSSRERLAHNNHASSPVGIRPPGRRR